MARVTLILAEVTGYDVLNATVPAALVFIAAVVVPPFTSSLARRRDERVAAVAAFASTARTMATGARWGWFAQRPEEHGTGHTAVRPDRYTATLALHNAEARIALAIPAAAQRARTTADAVVTVATAGAGRCRGLRTR